MTRDPRITTVGQVPAGLQPRRAAPAHQRAQGRDEPRRPPAGAARPRWPSSTSELRDRLKVKPGLTGLWQVEARDNPSFDAYRRLDLYYVENWSVVAGHDHHAGDGRARDRPPGGLRLQPSPDGRGRLRPDELTLARGGKGTFPPFGTHHRPVSGLRPHPTRCRATGRAGATRRRGDHRSRSPRAPPDSTPPEGRGGRQEARAAAGLRRERATQRSSSPMPSRIDTPK